ncbi:MAG: elongation factor G [Eubacteriales bacterium]|nr:elongation factor G [Clostridiales bacterium]MDY5835685.1 elongation factor G [Eubacteriales bacterium]
MKVYTADNIRNISLVGHSGAGKTSLIEAMLYNSKALDRMGKVTDGNTVSDFTEEEIARGSSINTSYAACEWKNCKINLIDAPGDFDFVGEQNLAMFAGDVALIVASARDTEAAVGADKAMRQADKSNMPVAMFINRVDEPNSSFTKAVEAYQEAFGSKVIPLSIPIVENEQMTGFVDVLQHKAYKLGDRAEASEITIPAEFEESCSRYYNALMEQIAETDEELMTKFFDDEPFSPEEIEKGIVHAISEKTLIPVFGGSAINDMGVTFFMDTVVRYFPRPTRRSPVEASKAGGEVIELPCDSKGPLAAFIFKTIMDPFVGRISLIRVFSGEFDASENAYNLLQDSEERINGLYVMRGKKQFEVDKLYAGDVGALTKLTSSKTNETLSLKDQAVTVKPVTMPVPCLSMAITSVKSGEEDKVMQGMNRLSDEDISFTIANDAETSQLVLSGQGEIQLMTLCNKLKNKFGTEAVLSDARVPYRETIRKKVRVQGKHKKQTGGHGQYGDVWIRFEPGTEDELEFSEEVVGGAVPKNYFPAVEKGLQEAVKEGPLAGYPVVKLKAILDDGSYHDVDSNEMSFIQAARLAYRNGLPQADPIILEPISSVKIHIPDSYLGDIMGDMSKRRGRILGMGADPEESGYQVVDAEAPTSELMKYATDLRSMTQGRGYFSMEFARYEQAPTEVSQKVIALAQAAKEDQ